MARTIELSETVQKQLSKFDRTVIHRLQKFLHERLAAFDDPRSIGDALHGSRLGEFWKYLVGDYRLICSLQDTKLVVLVLRVGHRKEVYDR